ncbi:Morphine 6-dehydrogenase [bioreactor metagenome]|uniref:Morphine 6-dehydrogenase n=1 Tax=bioreactor metagenome TaxID=1076179 RepID=A0A644Z988_9ZZZZ
MGEAIKESGIPREEIFLTTKIWPNNYGYEKAKRAIQASLDTLGVDYIDLMLLHQQLEDYIGAWKALEEAVGEGKIRSIGISNFKINTVQKLLDVAKIKPVVDQVECHPYFQQNELRAFLKKNDILLEAWYPIGHGDKKMLGDPVLAEIATAHGKSIVQVILRWHMQVGNIAIPKSTNPAHIKSNLEIFDFALSEEEMKKIGALDKNRGYYNLPDWVQRILFKFIK